MSYPFQYFVTSKSLSKNNLEDISYIFNKNIFLKKSILELYKTEIYEYIENNKIKINDIEKNNSILEILSNKYQEYLIKSLNPNPKLFFTYFIDYQIILNKNINNINILKNLFESITKKNIEEYNENLSFINPLNTEYLNEFHKNDIINSIDPEYLEQMVRIKHET